MSLDEIIKAKITEALAPKSMELINESELHQGHAGDNGTGETHYRLMVVSEQLSGLSKIECQRAVYQVLSEEMKDKIHALSIEAKAP